MRLIKPLIIAVLVALVVAGVAFGIRFRPGFSMHDKRYFGDSPHIVVHTNTATYGLRWQYGKMGFYFEPRSKVVNGELCFSLQATSSSGAYRGRYSEIPITNSKKVQALQRGGAFWLGPDGEKVRLEVRKM